MEVANFDIQAIKNPGIQGGWHTSRESSITFGTCGNISCTVITMSVKTRAVKQIQEPGTTGTPYRVLEGETILTGREPQLRCATNATGRENPGKAKFLWGWQPKVKSFRAETFMSTIRWKLVRTLGCEYTYGYITKSRRIELKLEKSHVNDAFVIAGGTNQSRTIPITIQQVRRNNRSLQKFYDAKYIDLGTGEKASGQELNCGRRTRNKNLNTENLRKYRGEKVIARAGKYPQAEIPLSTR